MPNRIVLGAQWGDEGKAKIIDYLTEKSDAVVRFQGGANAGHTVVVDDKKYIFHLMPSGILYENKICVVGNGVVLDLEELFKEIEFIKKEGINVNSRLYVSNRAHIVMPYHKEMDRIREKNLGAGKIGTTGRGIGPAYSDKVSRVGIRVIDLLSPETLKEKVEKSLFEKNFLFEHVYNEKPMDADKICREYLELAEKLKPYVAETSALLNKFISEGKSILFEGAQGTFLDIDHGTYPFVTSSNTVSGNACSGAGIGPKRIHEVIGVVKAYITRVGNGVFPTEAETETAEQIRKIGGEFGATTGRPRRCGWLDAVMLKTAVEINGIDSIALTKLDVLDSFETIKIAIGYTVNGKRVDYFPASLDDLAKAEPIYETLPGWKSTTSQCTKFSELPENAKKYINRIKDLTDADIKFVSVGPQRCQTIKV